MSVFLLLLVTAVIGSTVLMATLGWLSQRINRIEGGGSRELQRLLDENEELREQMRLLEGEVERLAERVDFTEKLLEKPR